MLRSVRAQLRAFAPTLTEEQYLRWRPRLERARADGVCIGVLDTGLQWTHPLLRDTWLECRDFTGSGTMSDSTGHGTKNFALLAARCPGEDGVPPLADGARFLVAKAVCDDERRIAAAIDWVVAQGAQILALPFGRGRWAARIRGALAAAGRSGCLAFGAAGNRGPEQLLFPASAHEVVAVTGARPNGQVLDFCCRAELAQRICLGVVASPLALHEGDLLQGSSPACMLAAGLAALHRKPFSPVEADRAYG